MISADALSYENESKREARGFKRVSFFTLYAFSKFKKPSLTVFRCNDATGALQ